MDRPRRTLLLAALLLASSSFPLAQTAMEPAGHWTGALHAPDADVDFQLDLVKNNKGALTGTVSIPSQLVKGLPLVTVTVEGRTVNFRSRKDQWFIGDVSADGKSMTGSFTLIGPLGNPFSIPFTMTRAGAAKVEPPIKNAAIGKDLTGTWNGTGELNGTPLRLVLKLANQPEGGTGRMVIVDQGGLEVPLAITQKASEVTLNLTAVSGSYSGALNAAGTEMVGTYKQGPLTVPVTFRRAPVAAGKP